MGVASSGLSSILVSNWTLGGDFLSWHTWHCRRLDQGLKTWLPTEGVEQGVEEADQVTRGPGGCKKGLRISKSGEFLFGLSTWIRI